MLSIIDILEVAAPFALEGGADALDIVGVLEVATPFPA
jgi:hypothetical protein